MCDCRGQAPAAKSKAAHINSRPTCEGRGSFTLDQARGEGSSTLQVAEESFSLCLEPLQLSLLSVRGGRERGKEGDLWW